MQTKYCAGRKLQIRHSIGRASDVDYSTFDGRTSDVEYSTFDYEADRIEKIRSEEGCFECRIFDIRRADDRMSNILHPKHPSSDVEYSTLDGGQYRIENRIESFYAPLVPQLVHLPYIIFYFLNDRRHAFRSKLKDVQSVIKYKFTQ